MNKFNNTQGLDSPLVVHKKSDSSYIANASELELNKTHQQEDTQTLERHRYKKDKKHKSNKSTPIILIILIVLCIIFALYYTGIIGDRVNNGTTNSTTESTTQTTTSIEQKYADTIVIKGTFIFVNGREVNGIEGLQGEIKYETVSPTRFSIIQENINESYYNDEILPILTEMGFYDQSTKVTVVHSTGLMAEEELATQAPTEAITDAETTTNENALVNATEQIPE